LGQEPPQPPLDQPASPPTPVVKPAVTDADVKPSSWEPPLGSSATPDAPKSAGGNDFTPFRGSGFGDSGFGGMGMGMGPMGAMGGLGPGGPAFSFRYGLTAYGDARVTGASLAASAPDSPKFGMIREDASLVLPVGSLAGGFFSFTTNLTSEIIHTSAVFPTTGGVFPSDLWNVRFGANYVRPLGDGGDGWVAGGMVSVGSASDRPFDELRDTSASVNAFVRMPLNEVHAWMFSLTYSSNSQVLANIPIPGVAYFYTPSDRFQASVGLPFASMNWRPLDDLSVQLSYGLLTNARARVNYRFLPQFRGYVGFDSSNENFFRAERTDDQDRLYYNELKTSAGLQYDLGKAATLDLSGGYAFDRFYTEGHSFSFSGGNNRIDLGNAPFVKLQLQMRF
jgi:hypothetical protein